MANTFISVKQIARETLPRLIDNLVFPNLIYRDTNDGATAKQGDTVSIRRPVRLQASTFSPQSGVSAQGIVEESVDVKLENIATVDAEVSSLESALNFDSVTRLFIEPAAAALAEKINDDGLALYKDIPYVGGTAGTTPSALADFAEAAFMMDTQRVPTNDRRGVWDPAATAAFKQIPAIVNAEKCGSTKALRSGSIGRIFGIDNYMTQAVRTHTAGDLSAGEGSLKVKSAVTNSGTVQINGTATATGSVVKGDILKIGNKIYVVTANATASSGTISVKVYPNITASQNEAVTLIGSHKANLVFHPSAFAFVTRPLSQPAGVESYVTSYNGISLRVVRGYDMKYKKEMLSMDVLYSFATLYPELACRYLG
ncbi:MAG: P22 coat protein [Clostridia bacterium]|nr:P22 coat protein [Clostridia bacterium]MBR6289887.1 P22 coat protein [Clostridia bacterium]